MTLRAALAWGKSRFWQETAQEFGSETLIPRGVIQALIHDFARGSNIGKIRFRILRGHPPDHCGTLVSLREGHLIPGCIAISLRSTRFGAHLCSCWRNMRISLQTAHPPAFCVARRVVKIISRPSRMLRWAWGAPAGTTNVQRSMRRRKT